MTLKVGRPAGVQNESSKPYVLHCLDYAGGELSPRPLCSLPHFIPIPSVLTPCYILIMSFRPSCHRRSFFSNPSYILGRRYEERVVALSKSSISVSVCISLFPSILSFVYPLFGCIILFAACDVYVYVSLGSFLSLYSLLRET